MLVTAVTYKLYAQDLPKSLARVAAQPQVARDTAHYLAKIDDVKSIDAFLADAKLFTYATKAFGLGDMTYAKGFMRKVLTEGVENSRSFANTLSDPRYREFAATFNFAEYGETATIFDRARQGVTDRYARQSLEEQAGAQNETVRLALYFQRKAPGVTNVYQILADKALTKITQTLLNLPASTSALNIDRQAEMLKSRLNLTDFQDSAKLQKLTTRFINLSDAQSESTGVATAATLFSRSTTIDQNLFFSLQGLRRGGN